VRWTNAAQRAHRRMTGLPVELLSTARQAARRRG
jgi:hypothetical protein